MHSTRAVLLDTLTLRHSMSSRKIVGTKFSDSIQDDGVTRFKNFQKVL